MKSSSILLALGGVLLGECATANNIQVSNTTLTGNTGSEVMVQFDIGWENSWRGNGVANWDAAWVFVKFKLPGDGGYTHALLEPSGHVAPSGSLVEPGLVQPGSAYNASTNPAVGVFIRRDADGTGTFSATGVQLRWNYGAMGSAFEDIREVRVYAIEMVHINQGAFHLGTGGTETNAFRNGTTGQPYQIFQEGGSIYIDAGQLWADGEIEAGTLPPSFPKGYAASYMMKYEMSQQQYVDFLNSLTRTQQAARVESDISPGTSVIAFPYVMTENTIVADRNGIRCDATVDPQSSITFYCDANANGIGGEADDGQWVACNNMLARDVLAYLDWSGLRLMTELEYEKACRGPLPPLVNEFPWRTTTIVAPNAYALANAFTANEGISNGYSTSAGNAVHGNTAAMRVGIFAANPANTGRTTAGASYYGIMELAGNQYEIVISAGNAAGRAYTGIHGNGALTGTGAHDVVSWPPVTDYDQLGLRGGASTTPAADVDRLHVSDRSLGASANWTIRIEGFGCRGVRTAP
ncbi:MAG TPA: SUMF1/EgtB/PvdO family nonheme iron enzyme [Flavobacteriales bacterium]|nr:SUMF1/EgtB/PvdO family nonheme iron enzyme [Flavobacteriales bacterium]HMR26166.1 SUMF1/EgtB/PvdO family nonheme iron enzyme [Flavobacteriales bacterium]